MAKDFSKLLTSLGLSGSETRVYLASLKLGPNSVQDIAKKARLSRTATYDAIKSLQSHGLISTYETGKKRYFAAEDPDQAVAHFRDEISNMNKQLEVLSRALPEFKMLSGGERPSVRFYEGKEAVYAGFHDVVKVAPKELLEVTNFNDIQEFLDDQVLNDARKLTQNSKMNIKMLYIGNAPEKKVRREYRKLPKGLGDFHGDIWIYDNRVVFVTFIGKIMTIIIESEAFSQVAKVMFKAAWMSGELAE